MPAQTEYSAPAWGQSMYQDLTVPSGGLILVKKLDLQDIVAAGLMDEFDQLAPEAEEKVVGPAQGRKKPSDRPAKKLTKKQQEAKQAADLKKSLSNVEEMGRLTRLMGLILPVIVKKPTIVSTYFRDEDNKWQQIDPSDREQGVIYVDSIPLPDQMFILEWAMEGIDMSDFKSIRGKSVETVGSVDDVPVPEDAPEPVVRDPE